MAEKSRKLFAIVAVWLVVAAIGAGVYKFVIAPSEENKIIDETGSDSQFKHTVRVGHDSFSGYCLLRSASVATQLAGGGIRLEFHDDGADYTTRIEALAAGKLDLAVFTVDALIKSSAELGSWPGTIVLVIDETRGADAMVARKSVLPDIQALARPEARLVLTPDSPSETLARVLFAHFDFADPLGDRMIPADGAEDVLERLKATPPTTPHAFVLWEPYVSKALEEPDVHVLLDSSQLRGYIVDVLVANRRFLKEDTAGLTRSVLEAYLRAAYEADSRPDGMQQLVIEDARTLGSPLTPAQAQRLAAGILWKNTLENYAHMGVVPPGQGKRLQNLEAIIRNIIGVQVQTGALKENPLSGKESSLFYNAILEELHDADFHPARKLAALTGIDDEHGLAEIRADENLAALSDADWDALVEVGTLRVDKIHFGRGSARMNVSGERELEALAEKLEAWPHYYLRVIGNAARRGDPESNRALAKSRAEAAVAGLTRLGVSPMRIRAEARDPKGTGAEAQSVAFVVGQREY